jgi:diguanylate cyclase (GGDEF)-like protein
MVDGRAGLSGGQAVVRAIAFIVAALLVAVPCLAATTPTLELALLATDDALEIERVRAPGLAGHFTTLPRPATRLLGGPGQRHWLRLRIGPTAAGGDATRWVLRIGRLPVEQIEVWLALPGERARLLGDDGFYAPEPNVAGLRSSYAVELPALTEAQELYVGVKTRSRVQFEPQLLPAAQHAADDAAAGLRAVAILTGLLVLALCSLVLHVALRDRRFLAFAGLAASSALWLAASAGHLHQLPGATLFAWLGAHGPFVLGLLMAAAALHWQQQVLACAGQRVLSRTLDGLRYLLLALAAIGLLRLGSAPLTQAVGTALLAAVLPLLVVTAALRRWQGFALALPVGLLWLLVALAWLPLLASGLGWMAPGRWVELIAPLLLGLVLLLYSLLLIASVREFRERHDRVQALQQQTGADLEVEQRRRQFNEALREAMRNAGAPGDLEWRAFKQLTQTLAGLIPHRAIALSATGYRGFDFLLTEPMSAKARYCNLLAGRASTLKGICRSRSPVQLKLDLGSDQPGLPAESALFGIVPLQIARPGWGALLLERDADDGFDARELALAAEFVALTLAAADEAAAHAELRRTADVDPLTGVLNRRAGEARLEQLLRQSSSERSELALLMVDLDHFKQVNDKYGEAAGDECLRGLVDAIRPYLGVDDVLMRHGGDEFLVILPERGSEEARELAERIRAQVAMLRIEADGALIKLTASVGVAVRVAADARIQPLLERTGRALDFAKHNGRNQVQVGSAHAGQGEAAGIPPLY